MRAPIDHQANVLHSIWLATEAPAMPCRLLLSMPAAKLAKTRLREPAVCRHCSNSSIFCNCFQGSWLTLSLWLMVHLFSQPQSPMCFSQRLTRSIVRSVSLAMSLVQELGSSEVTPVAVEEYPEDTSRHRSSVPTGTFFKNVFSLFG